MRLALRDRVMELKLRNCQSGKHHVLGTRFPNQALLFQTPDDLPVRHGAQIGIVHRRRDVEENRVILAGRSLGAGR
jgi:hypothetical protein